jgi:hypothetical protein
MIDEILLPRLKEAIETQGSNYKAISKKAKLGETAVRDIVVGRVRNPGVYTLDRIAAALGTSLIELLVGEKDGVNMDNSTIPLLGYVGGGEAVYPYDDLPLLPRTITAADRDSINCEWVDAPPGRYPNGVVALRVTGPSMKPYMPAGTIVYYANRIEGGAPAHCVASLCVVQLADGKTLLKLVQKSQKHGKFDLHSYNNPPITDVDLAWCAPVIFIKPSPGGFA